MAARIFSEEQLSMVANATIVDADGIDEIKARLAELSPDEMHELLSRMVDDPSLLREANLADLASVLAKVNAPNCAEVRRLPSEGN